MKADLPAPEFNLPHGVSSADIEGRFALDPQCEGCAVVEDCGDQSDECRGPFEEGD